MNISFPTDSDFIPYPDFLRCTELQPFWTRVDGGGVLEIGQGVYPYSALLDFGPVAQKDASQIVFSKPELGQPAYWHVKQSEGTCINYIENTK